MPYLRPATGFLGRFTACVTQSFLQKWPSCNRASLGKWQEQCQAAAIGNSNLPLWCAPTMFHVEPQGVPVKVAVSLHHGQ